MDAILIFNYQQFNKISVDLKFRKNHQSIFFKAERMPTSAWFVSCVKLFQNSMPV